MNLYTLPGWRNKGIARKLMKKTIHYAQVQNINRMSLHATEAGQKLYETYGFHYTSNEMKKYG